MSWSLLWLTEPAATDSHYDWVFPGGLEIAMIIASCGMGRTGKMGIFDCSQGRSGPTQTGEVVMRMGFWAVLSFIVLAAAGCSSGSTRDTAESRLKDWVNLQAAKVGENPDAAPVTFCERDRDCAMNERCEIIEGICQPHACPIVFSLPRSGKHCALFGEQSAFRNLGLSRPLSRSFRESLRGAGLRRYGLGQSLRLLSPHTRKHAYCRNYGRRWGSALAAIPSKARIRI